MINVVFDTNIWLYLANGFDALSKKFPEGSHHIELFNEIKKKQDEGEIKLIINDVILIEWERNKHHTQSRIEKLKRRIEEVDKDFKKIRNYYDADDVEAQEKLNDRVKEKIQTEIEENEKHIEIVEKFLKEECQIIEISDEVKKRVWELAIKKDVPFLKNKNNIGDATLFFSAIEFLETTDPIIEGTIFISNNSEDFCEEGNRNEFHPKLIQHIKNRTLKYARTLHQGIKFSEEMQVQIEEIQKEIEELARQEAYLESISFYCQSFFCEGNEHIISWGYLDNKIKILDKSFLEYDPNQLNLFPDLPIEEPKIRESGFGDCVICGTTHIECPNCGEIICGVSIWADSEVYKCEYCESKFRFDYNKRFEEQVVYLDIEENSEER
ncbi:MAG: DUF4935 domain-containing protein [Lewinellaceae bacterium]|nr:DUF4935 domain-containing protein [Lewinellaceae bacterium]